MTSRHAGVLGLVIMLATTGAGARAAEACIWITGTSVHGDRKEVSLEPDDIMRGLNDHTEHEQRASQPLGPTPPQEAPWDQRSDHAALLLYRGQPHEAVAILESIERRHPGEYVVAANLGTAHELAGNDREARRWIIEGIRRNPASHAGTEWLHVRILDAKIALAEDPAWLETHSVLDLDFGTDTAPAAPSRWPDGQHLASTQEALRYQLRERTGFVKPPDPIVGDLLADYANLIAIEYTIESALPVYDLALEYQPPRAAAIKQRRDRLAERASARARRDAAVRWGAIVAIPLLLAALVWLVVRRRRRRSPRA